MTWSSGLFDGKRSVVTGAGGGIGRAVVDALVGLGARVLAVDRNSEALAEIDGVESIAGDLTDPAVRAAVIAQAGAVDHLVNVAGFQKLIRPAEVTVTDWDALFDVNVKAPFFLTRDLSPQVVDGGRIVFFSSVAARSGETPETMVYAAAKTALLSITRSLAYQYGPRGICVNSILPGIFNTQMQDLVLDDIAALRGISVDRLAAARLSVVALGRTADPRECADAVLWLLSPAAAYVTGQGIAVDGGYTMA